MELGHERLKLVIIGAGGLIDKTEDTGGVKSAAI